MGTSSAPSRCQESRRLVQGGRELRRKSPWSLPLNPRSPQDWRLSKRGRVTGVNRRPVTAGGEGPDPVRERQREWYRRVFSNALSLSSEAKRFLFCVKEDCLWSVLYAVSLWKRDTFPAKALCSGRRRSPDFPCRPGREMCCWEKLWGCCGQRRTSAGIAGRLRSNTE